MKNKDRILIIISILLLVVVALRFGIMKNSFFIDEIYSYGLSNSYYHPFPFKNGTWFSSKYYSDYLMPNSNTVFEYGSVIYNQVNDVHPPLYYIIFHTISSFFPGVFSKWIGLSLNMAIHIGIILCIYYIVKHFTDNKWVSLIAMIFYGLSIGGLSSFLYIRMYAMMGLIQMLLIIFTMKFINADKVSKRNLFITFLTVLVGGLTHYYFYIFAFFTTVIVFIYHLIIRKHIKGLIYSFSSLLAVITAFISFPSVIDHITSTNRGNEVTQNLEGGLAINNISRFTTFVSNHIFSGYLNLILFIFILLTSIYLLRILKDRNYKSIIKKVTISNKIINYFIILFSTLFYIILVSQVSHYQTARYIYPIYPLVVIIFLVGFYVLLDLLIKYPKINLLTIGLVSFLLTTLGIYNFEPEFLNTDLSDRNTLVEEYNDNNVMVLSDSSWIITTQVEDLQYFESVYPHILNDEMELPEKDDLFLSEDLVVFIIDSYDSLDLKNNVLNTYEFDGYSSLYQYYGFNVYYFYRK